MQGRINGKHRGIFFSAGLAAPHVFATGASHGRYTWSELIGLSTE
ncbi:hypothetical protein ACFL6C_04660 [Myxococcota bacterium]